ARTRGRLAPVLPDQVEARHFDVVNLAAVVRDASDLQPVAVRIDHAPPHEVVDGRAPQHRFLATGIHGDVAADAGSVGRGWIHREHQACTLGRLRDAAGHDTGL